MNHLNKFSLSLLVIFLFSVDAHSSFANDEAITSWNIQQSQDKLTDSVKISAFSVFHTTNDGQIEISANCVSDGIAFTFNYFAASDVNSYFETQGTAHVVHIPYRLDSGDVLETFSSTSYKNSAIIVLSTNPSRAGGLLGAFLPGFKPIDLGLFLHSNLARFQFPLGGGITEVVSIVPRSASLTNFISSCGFNPRNLEQSYLSLQEQNRAAKERAQQDEKHRKELADSEQRQKQSEQFYNQFLASVQSSERQFGRIPLNAVVRDDELNGHIYLQTTADMVVTNPGRPPGFTLPSGTHFRVKVGDVVKVKDGILSVVELAPDYRKGVWGVYDRQLVRFDIEGAQQYAATHPVKPAPTSN